jgi:cysteine desulfurase
MKKKRIYLDNAATTMCDKRVVDAMIPYYTETYAVASSQFSHTPGIESKEGLDNGRKVIGETLNALPEEIVFTSGATESNNMVIKGIATAYAKKGNHIITSSIEHRSVLESSHSLAKEGFEITELPVSQEGFVSPDSLQKEIRKETILVSIQHANQETGTIQDIDALGSICRERGVFFHTDCAMSFGRIPIDVKRSKIDLLSITGHKIHGPKGVGALFVRDEVRLSKLMDGGFNESNRRAGTENIPGVVGFAKAVELISTDEVQYIESLKKRLYDGITKNVNSVSLNGTMGRSLPTVLNLTFRFVEGESVILHLDMRGIAVITGSACFSRSLEPSFVLKAMGITNEEAHGSIRFSFSRFNTEDEIDETIEAVSEIVHKLREISPITPKE